MINSAIDKIGKENCTGCFGCSNACSLGAIKMKLSQEGFYVPEIDENKCSGCGACSDICPVLNYSSSNFSKDEISVYAAYSTNDHIRLMSSSGGIFSEIAMNIIEKGGLVYGAGWENGLNVKHVGINKTEELAQLRSSKYVQSNLNGIYSEILHNIKLNKKVLFTGTPCQVAAIKNLTSSDNLYTLDVVCHGIPSRIVFDEYIKYISGNNPLKSYTFRDKSLGWSKYKVKAEIKNGTSYECITREDPFFHGFICDLYSNLSCYNCKFSTLPRAGDLTLGDFWGISEDIMDERGISLVLVNNEKGRALLEEINLTGNIKLYPKSLEDAVKKNPRAHNGFLNMRKNRNKILSSIKKEGFIKIYEKYIKNTDRYIPDI